ncbi:hypothetical protein TNCV_4228481 [Trichonephila clavipes]|nr:hypothetical protein TNCV_4228481 [Trichonephila clavipes]
MRYPYSLPNEEKNHTIEDLIKSSISAFLKTVLEKDDNADKAMLLSNNTVSRSEFAEEMVFCKSLGTTTSAADIYGVMAWLCYETETKYPHSTKSARKLLFPSSYLAEYGFSAVTDLKLALLSKMATDLTAVK